MGESGATYAPDPIGTTALNKVNGLLDDGGLVLDAKLQPRLSVLALDSDYDAAGAAAAEAVLARNASNLASGTVADARLPATAQAATLMNTYGPGGTAGNVDAAAIAAAVPKRHQPVWRPGYGEWAVPVMAAPLPTVTWYEWNTASGTILNPKLEYAFDDFTVVTPVNAKVETILTTGPGDVSMNKISGDFGVIPWSIEFDSPSDEFVLRYRPWSDGGARLWLWVDGKAMTVDPVVMSDSHQIGAIYAHKVTFATAATRRIRIFLELADYHGIWAAPTKTTVATHVRRARIAFVGDSWAEGSGATFTLTSHVWQVGRFLDAEVFAAAEGGTGYSNNGGAPRKKFGDTNRLDRVQAVAPDLVVACGSINDDNQATLQADAAAYYAAIATRLPGVPIVVVGTQDLAGTPSAARLANAAAVKAAALAAPNVVKYVDPIAEAWITGTGKTTAPAGDGNADLFIGPDGVHPSQAGHDYLARQYAAVLQDVL